MKLYLDLDNYDYQPERYKYAVEQMMLTFFPEERPEYPPREGPYTEGGDQRRPLHPAPQPRVDHRPRPGVPAPGDGAGCGPCGERGADRPPEQVYHTLQHALKMAFYQAGTALLGGEPPWGALTGVRPVKLPTPGPCWRGPRRPRPAGSWSGSTTSPPAGPGWRWSAPGPVWRRTGSWKRDRCPCISVSPSVPPGCAYCSFVSADVGRALKLVDPYVEALLEEVRRTGQVLEQAGLRVRTLYVGGGTPTTLSASQLDRLLAAAEAHLPLAGCGR